MMGTAVESVDFDKRLFSTLGLPAASMGVTLAAAARPIR
jgi:hypothetical protein